MSNRSPLLERLLLAVCASAFAMPGAAQPAPEPDIPPPAHVAYLDGSATLARDGRTEEASLNLPLLAGDQLRTREGRAEVIFGDGSVLDIDHFTTVDFLSDELLRLLDGRVRLTIGGRHRVSYRIDTPAGAVRIDTPGEYRIALLGESGRARDVEVIAIRGFATLANDLGETQVRAGERAFATASMAPSYAQEFNSAYFDAFDRWAADRRDERTGTMSARYLPDEIRHYSGSFDRHGDWRYEDTYGYVWYPRAHVEWRPYSYGRWGYYRPWGWTWIAYDPWGWPTHHYGRWGFRAGAWFWIPSRRWAPAHVYWASAPGYIGWCPLGWDGRPVVNIINVNVGLGRRGYGYHDAYRAWTVVPRHAFAARGDVREYAVPRARIERAVPRWSVASAVAPVKPAGVTRSATAIHSAGRLPSVRRGEQPETAAPGALAGPGPSRASRRAAPEAVTAPRATPPTASGVLSAPVRTGDSDAPSARPRYRDLGPGGSDAPAPNAGRPRGVPDNAPRGVPDRAPGYAPRGVPRGEGAPDRGRPEWQNPYERSRTPEAERPPRRAPEYSRPAPSSPPSEHSRPSARPREHGQPSAPPREHSRPSAPPREQSRPSARPAPSPRGGDRPAQARPAPQGERAAPRARPRDQR